MKKNIARIQSTVRSIITLLINAIQKSAKDTNNYTPATHPHILFIAREELLRVTKKFSSGT